MDRTQVVVVDGEQSGPVPVTAGHEQTPPKHHPARLHATRTYTERCR